MGNRRRRPNWLTEEKILLLDLVQMSRIVGCKKTDTVSVRRKNREWQYIANKYNSAAESTLAHRTWDNLKAQWENMKKVAKKTEAKLRADALVNGGCVPSTIEDPIHTRVIRIIENQQLFELTIPSDNEEEDIKNIVPPAEPQYTQNNRPSTSYQNDSKEWSDNNMPAHLRDTATPVKCTKRRRSNSSYLEALLKKKRIKALDLQMKIAVEESRSLEELRKIDKQTKQQQLRGEKLRNKLLLLELRSKNLVYEEQLLEKAE